MGASAFRIVWRFHMVGGFLPATSNELTIMFLKGSIEQLHQTTLKSSIPAVSTEGLYWFLPQAPASVCGLVADTSAIVCAVGSSGSRGAAWLAALYKPFICLFLLGHHSISDFFLLTLWLGLTGSPNERWDSAIHNSDGFSRLGAVSRWGWDQNMNYLSCSEDSLSWLMLFPRFSGRSWTLMGFIFNVLLADGQSPSADSLRIPLCSSLWGWKCVSLLSAHP